MKTQGNDPQSIPVELLTEYALKACDNAYAPYSRFCVGAAILAESGEIYTGANCENASYGATICAERAAIASAVSAGERKFSAIAVTARDSSGRIVKASPCGICRQVMAEFGDMTVITVMPDGCAEFSSVCGLLPDAFNFLK